MTLNELKAPFESMLKTIDFDTSDLNSLATNYNTYQDEDKKNKVAAVLICASWPSLCSIYFNQAKTNLSVEECFDIFLDAFSYVVDRHVWDNKDSSLYKDKNGFVKAMSTCIKSRKLNYIIAQYRQKRIANYTALSIDLLNEIFQEGYFNYYDNSYISNENEIKNIVVYFFNSKKYLWAFIVDAILNFDVFSNDYILDLRKVHKHIRHIDTAFCDNFAITYNLDNSEVNYCLKYFQNLPNYKLDSSLKRCLQELKSNDIILNILKSYEEE